MAHSFVFEKITREDCAGIRAGDGWEMRSALEAAACRGDSWLRPAEADATEEAGALREIELDLLFHAAVFATEQQFGDEQLSAFLSIVWRTHVESMQRRLTLRESCSVFERHVVAHSVHRPPRSAQVFSLAEVRDVQAYVVGTYYRSYKLYQHCFTPPAEARVEDAMHPPPQPGRQAEERYPPWGPEPPRPFRPLQKALPLEEWKAREEERVEKRRAEEAATAAAAGEAQQETDEERAERERAERAASAEPTAVDALPQPTGLKAQLSTVAAEVTKMSLEQIQQLENELDSLNERLTEAKEKAPKKKK